ncbi:phospholipase A and acyltransferase 4-like [Patiria miniata]|uniref:LRAT domain-containing protein n=1 Tax=Patiria miniata TaxID=46514 RepID=A0A914ADT5_PATMI|nr:phospholipase A and acyltransferase 4-like [Patiria miniata]
MERGRTPIDANLLDSDREHWSGEVFVENSFGNKGKWFTSKNIADLEDEVCPGDRLEFDHYWYAHWGIYVGRYLGEEHAVIHFSMPTGRSAFLKRKISGSAFAASQKPEIRADTIGKILGGSGKVRINNSRDHTVKHLDPNDIIGLAKKMHRDKTSIDYHLLDSNCEHFVNLCRYHEPHSAQAEAVQKTGLRCGIGVLVTIAVLIFICKYLKLAN